MSDVLECPDCEHRVFLDNYSGPLTPSVICDCGDFTYMKTVDDS